MLKPLKVASPFLNVLEAGLIGLFFIQALRFAIGALYGQLAGVSAAFAVDPAVLSPDAALPSGGRLNDELAFAGYMVLLPLLTLIFGRIRFVTVIAVALVAVGRALMHTDAGLTPTEGALLAVGGGLVYVLMIIRFRLRAMPYFFVLGLAADQIFRAVGNTLDPSWSAVYEIPQLALSAIAILLALLTFLVDRAPRDADRASTSEIGLMPLYGAFGMGGLLFLNLALLALPNVVANRADTDYTTFVPILLVATLLPVIPAVRAWARNFVALFDPNLRGWVWMLLIALLIVFGTRLRGIGAGVALSLSAFFASMMWWWLARPRTERERSFAGLWMVFGVAVFGLLVAADNFTYEYAFVRDFGGNFAFLNDVFPPLLRGLRGFGLGVLLLGVFFAALPMTQTQRRIPWVGGTPTASVTTLVLVVIAAGGVSVAARPPLVAAVRGVETMRVATYNIHSGFDEFYNYNLEAIARTILQSGANVVLLQEVEGGRMTSLGVDQPLWLARRVGMDRRYFPTNEGLHGLAVLSNIPIAFDDGALLDSLGSQTGLQRIQIQPEPGVVVTLYNTWLSPLLEVTGEEGATEEQVQDQERQLNQIFTIVASHHPGGVLGRTILAGTFHNVPDSPLAEQMLAAGFVDAFAGQPLEISATFVRAGLPRARFDYLWLVGSPGTELEFAL